MRAFHVEQELRGTVVIKAKDEDEARKIAAGLTGDQWEVEPRGNGLLRVNEVDAEDYFGAEEA